MLGMSKKQIETAVDNWYKNNPDKISSFVQGFGTANSSDDDDVLHLVSRVMASVGSTVALAAITDIMEQNNKVLTTQINQLIDEKIKNATSYNDQCTDYKNHLL